MRKLNLMYNQSQCQTSVRPKLTSGKERPDRKKIISWKNDLGIPKRKLWLWLSNLSLEDGDRKNVTKNPKNKLLSRYLRCQSVKKIKSRRPRWTRSKRCSSKWYHSLRGIRSTHQTSPDPICSLNWKSTSKSISLYLIQIWICVYSTRSHLHPKTLSKSLRSSDANVADLARSETHPNHLPLK